MPRRLLVRVRPMADRAKRNAILGKIAATDRDGATARASVFVWRAFKV